MTNGLSRASDALKFLAALAAVVAFRFAPHPPNVSPLLGAALPFSKKYGALTGGAFALLALVGIDFATGRLGLWTLYTGVAYGAVGFLAARFLANRAPSPKNFVLYAVPATLAYDAVTALAFGWQFGQPLAVTALGQIPFTLAHLAGNAFFAATLSPLLYKRVLAAPAPEPSLAVEPSPALAKNKSRNAR